MKPDKTLWATFSPGRTTLKPEFQLVAPFLLGVQPWLKRNRIDPIGQPVRNNAIPLYAYGFEVTGRRYPQHASSPSCGTVMI